MPGKKRNNGGERFTALNRRSVLQAGGFGLAGVLSSTAWAARPGAAVSVPTSETGTVTRDQPDGDMWYSVSLENSYTDPAVVMKPVSMDDSDPVHVRLRDVSGGSFEFKFEEWEYLDGGHDTATAHYAVVEAGTYTLPNGTTLEAGHTEADEGWRSVPFSVSFGSTPVVFSQAQTANGGQPIVTRNQRVSTEGFVVRVQEEEALGSHVTESVGYIAVEPTVSSGYEVGRTADTVTEDWHEIRFEQPYDSAVLIADMQTADGGNTAGLRYDGFDSGGVNVAVQEERSVDDEINHVTEQVGYLVATPGALFGDDSGGGGGDGDDDGDSVTVLEDFESRSLSGYAGDTGGFSFDTSSPIEASASLRGTSAGTTITAGEIETPRGYEYRCRVAPRAGSYQRLLVDVQDTSNPMRDCYALFVGPNWSDIAVQDRRNGSRADFVSADHSFTAGTEYVAGISVTAEGVWGTLYDADDNRLAQTPPMDSTAHSSGNLGFGVGPETGVLWDEVTRVELGSPPDNDDGGTDPANDAPTASNDSASVDNGRTVTVNVLSNDSDSDGSLDPSTVTVVTPPSNGSATVNSDGSIDYTHGGSDTQSDSFDYTVSDDAGATSNEATVSMEVTAPNGSGSTIRLSDYDSLQAAVNDASPGDTVLIDRDAVIGDVRMKSGVNIFGDGGTLSFSQGSTKDGLKLDGCSDVVIDGVDIDGNRKDFSGGGGGHLIGGRGLGNVSNIRITNCTLRNNVHNGITMHFSGSGEEGRDIYIAGNYLEDVGRHGVLLAGSEGAEVHDVIVEGNHVHNWNRAQGIGFFGHPAKSGGRAYNVAVLGNKLTHPAPTMQNNIGTIVAEERTDHSVIYGNVIDAPNHDGNGPVLSKDSQHNLVARNYASVAKAGAAVQNFAYHEDTQARNIIENVVTHNFVDSCKIGVKFQKIEGGNAAFYNRIVGCDKDLARRDTTGSSSDFVQNNDSSVPESAVSPPRSIGSSCSYNASGASASASWSRGSDDPNDPVRVTVSTEVNG